MRKICLILFGVAGLVGTGWFVFRPTPPSEPEPGPEQEQQIATVDFSVVRSKYHLYQKFLRDKEAEKKSISRQDLSRQNRIENIKRELDDLARELEGPPLSPAERHDLRQTGIAKEADIQALERERETFLQESQDDLEKKMAKAEEEILQKVVDQVKEYATSHELKFVFDSSATSSSETHFLAYARNPVDLTDEIIEILNQDAPKSAENE